MKDERNVRHRRAAGGKWQPVAIILAAVLMVLSVPLGGRVALAATKPGPVKVDDPCTLTVNPGNVEMAADLATANVVVDLYRVADAVEFPGYDTYKLEMTPDFASIVIPEKVDNAGWKEIAQKAADIVLGTAPDSGAKEWDPTETINKLDPAYVFPNNATNQPISLKAGLYLVIAHGSDINNYVMVNEPDPSSPDVPATGTVTVANSGTFAYKFAPELVSIPTKEAVDEVINTANPVNWEYDPVITLKPDRKVRVGNLKIIKDLINYRVHTITGEDGVTREVYDESTFVFKVTAYKSKAAYEEMGEKAPKVYNNYVSMMFKDAHESSVLIENLPVDAYVIVKEEYSGKTYSPADNDPDTKDTIILANDTVEVEFKNEYDDRHGGGGSVTNKFTYHEGMSEWGWERVTDSSETGTVIPPEPKE